MIGTTAAKEAKVAASFPIVCVDVGNNRLKFGLYRREDLLRLGPCASECSISEDPGALQNLADWLACQPAVASWWIATVNRPASTELVDWLRRHRPGDRVVYLTASDLPLVVNLPRPDMVGIDRLVDALAAKYLRQLPVPVLIVDVGSAITVDYLSADGAFEGGAILPGFTLAARALYDYTDMLPLLDPSSWQVVPPPLGKNTVAAMEAGLFWGAVGAVRELVHQMLPGEVLEAEVLFTGGGSRLLMQAFASPGSGSPRSDTFSTGPQQEEVFRPGLTVPPSLPGNSEGEQVIHEGSRRLLLRYIPYLTLLGIALGAAHVLTSETS
jgi:type III pantothenate kinase